MIGHTFGSALRGVRRGPVNAAIKLLALALGLACLLTAHVIGDYFERADSQWAKADRTYVIVQETLQGGEWISGQQMSAFPVAKYVRADIPELATVAQMRFANFRLTPADSQGFVTGLPVEPTFLEIFDLEMVAGEASLDRPRTVLLSEEGAARMFGGQDPLGRTLTTPGGVDLTVAGVYRGFPAASHLGVAGQMYLHALPSMDAWMDDYSARNPGQPGPWQQDAFQTLNSVLYVALPEDGSLTAAELDRRLADIAARRVPADQGQIRLRAMSMQTMSRSRFEDRSGMPEGVSLVTGLYLLGLLTLALGCANFASLSAAEAATRGREIGLRKTVGATRRQVAAHALAESLILAAGAVVLVAPLTGLIARAITARFGLPVSMPDPSRLDYWVGVAGIAALAAAAAGAYPAMVLAGLRPVFALRAAPMRGGAGVARALLIGAQFAVAGLLSVVLLVMLTQNASLRRTATQANGDPVVTLQLPTRSTSQDQEAMLESVRSSLLSSPAIQAVTFRYVAPFTTPTGQEYIYAQSPDAAAPRFTAQSRFIYFDYFETLGMTVLAGRSFSRNMDESRSAVIGASTAAKMGFTPAEAIGQPLYMIDSPDYPPMQASLPSPQLTIIGVVDDDPLDIAAHGGATNYAYHRALTGGYALIRLSPDRVEEGLAQIRETWEGFADVTANPAFLDTVFEQSYRAFYTITGIFALLSAIALAIAAMGLYGLASFAAQRRLREVGVRKTLGASSGRVMGRMLWDFSKPVIMANLIAWPVAFLAARRYLDLFVTRIDLTPAPFLIALGGSLAVALAAVGVHAWRAARVKPANVLKFE